MNIDIKSAGNQVLELARELGEHAIADSMDQELARRMSGGLFRVMLLGEINHGKSSLINALFRQPLLPVGVTPTTSTLICIRAGDQRSTHAVFEGERQELLDPSAFAELAKGKAKPDPLPIRLDLRCPSEDFDTGLEFVDTPGFNDLVRIRSRLSKGAIPKADLAVLVLDATQALTSSEVELFRQVFDAMGGMDQKQLVVVINRADLAPESSHAQLKQRVRVELGAMAKDHGWQGVPIFFTQANDPDNAGVAELRTHLAALSGQRASTLLPERARRDLRVHLDWLLQSASFQLAALDKAASELSQDLAAMETFAAKQQEDAQKIRDHWQSAREQVRSSVDASLQELRTELVDQTKELSKRADLEQLVHLLPQTLRDRLLAFGRVQGQKVQEILNHSTREVLIMHGARLEQQLSRLQRISTCQQPYLFVPPHSVGIEVSSVILGLVGTAVMYFGRTMPGLIMTIAGPLANVFLREKAVRQARDALIFALPDHLDESLGMIRTGLLQETDRYTEQMEQWMASGRGQIQQTLRLALERSSELKAQEQATRLHHTRSDLQQTLLRLEDLRTRLSQSEA